jgi:hypothetical protein
MAGEQEVEGRLPTRSHSNPTGGTVRRDEARCRRRSMAGVGGSAREVDRAGVPAELSVGGSWRSSRQRRGGRGGRAAACIYVKCYWRKTRRNERGGR